MTTQFENFHLSFIWVETIPAIFAQELGDAPCAFLGKPGQFAKIFNDLKASAESKEPIAGEALKHLQLPWPKPRGHHFWKYYFAGQHAGQISGTDAWNSRVPLRTKTATVYTVAATDPPEPITPKIIFEVFCTPQGVAVVVTVYYRGEPKSLEEITALAHAVRYRYRFRTGQHAGGGMSLESAATDALADARKRAFGNASAFAGNNQPFTIATFVQGHTDEPDVADGTPAHRALEALTGWNQGWPTMPLDTAAVATAKLAVHSRTASDLVYARERGRAIWLPREFERPSPVCPPRLSCYHRNLTLASLQTMSLGECVGWVARRRQSGQKIQPLLLQRARKSARILDLLASGDATTTYRTMSVNRQIEAAKWRPSIKVVTSSA